MSLETTYIVTGKTTGQLTFKYDLNGFLTYFKYEGEPLTEKQIKWLFPIPPAPIRFPYKEADIKNFTSIKEFTVTKGELDLGFDNFWNKYGHKAKKEVSRKIWESLSKDDKFNAIVFIKRYDNWLKQNRVAKALPDTYLRQRRWLDEL